MISLKVSVVFQVFQVPDFAETNMLLTIEILTCLKLLFIQLLHMSWKKPASPVSERFDLVLGVDGPAGMPAFKCKDLFHLRSMYLFTPYLLSSPFSSRIVIPLNGYSGEIGGQMQEIVENRDWDRDSYCRTQWLAEKCIH